MPRWSSWNSDQTEEQHPREGEPQGAHHDRDDSERDHDCTPLRSSAVRSVHHYCPRDLSDQGVPYELTSASDALVPTLRSDLESTLARERPLHPSAPSFSPTAGPQGKPCCADAANDRYQAEGGGERQRAEDRVPQHEHADRHLEAGPGRTVPGTTMLRSARGRLGRAAMSAVADLALLTWTGQTQE